MDMFGVDFGETVRCRYPLFLGLMIVIENSWKCG